MLATAVAAALIAGNASASGGPGPGATMTCALSGAVLHVRVHNWGVSNGFWLTRHKNAILARERIGPDHPETVPCTGAKPTVESVDRIAVNQDRHPGSEYEPSGSTFTVDMSHGAFAPGAPGAGGGSEIKTQLNLHRAQVWIWAPPGRNHLAFGVRHHKLGLKVDGDRTVDVVMGTPFLAEVFAGEGDDVIDGRTGSHDLRPRRPRLFLWGQGGDDRMIGGGKKDQLIGGNGADVMIGKYGASQLAGEEGPDRLIAGPERTLIQGDEGRDHLNARNGHPDWISCGPGNDHARADSREENMGGCEHAPSVHTRF